METIKTENLVLTSGGNWADWTCGILAAGSGVYAIGTLVGWWTPVGWISALAGVATVACSTYVLVNIFGEIQNPDE